jgi:hypothetical protein
VYQLIEPRLLHKAGTDQHFSGLKMILEDLTFSSSITGSALWL